MALNLEKIFPIGLLDVTANVAVNAGPAVPAPSGFDSPQVIRVDESTTFKFDWTVTGAAAAFFLPGADLKFDVFYEMMGPGEAVIAGSTTTTVGLNAPGLSTVLTIAASAVPAGVYRLVGRMMMVPKGGSTPTAICGFEDLGIVEYYDI